MLDFHFADSRKIRESDMHMVTSGVYQLGKELSRDERLLYTHEVAAPILYKNSDAAYYSESEYTANDWKFRYEHKYLEEHAVGCSNVMF